MKCPRCEGRRLQITTLLTGRVVCQFRDDGDFSVLRCSPFDSSWQDDSACRCTGCTWEGTVGEVKQGQIGTRVPSRSVPEPPSKSSNPSNSTAVGSQAVRSADIAGRLSADQPASVLKQDVAFLLKENQRLNRMVELLQRVANQPANDDTRIF